jgi:hypothetical protein
MSVASQSGRARSKSSIAATRAISSTVSKVPGAVAVTLRMWKSRSKSWVYTHRGGAGGADGTTRCRSIGRLREMRSKRLRTTFKSGDRSSTITVTTADRSRGSLSIAQVNASLSRMNSAICAKVRLHPSRGHDLSNIGYLGPFRKGLRRPRQRVVDDTRSPELLSRVVVIARCPVVRSSRRPYRSALRRIGRRPVPERTASRNPRG